MKYYVQYDRNVWKSEQVATLDGPLIFGSWIGQMGVSLFCFLGVFFKNKDVTRSHIETFYAQTTTCVQKSRPLNIAYIICRLSIRRSPFNFRPGTVLCSRFGCAYRTFYTRLYRTNEHDGIAINRTCVLEEWTERVAAMARWWLVYGT